MTFRLPHSDKPTRSLNYRFTSTPVDKLDVYLGLTFFVGKDLDKLRSATMEVLSAETGKRTPVLTDNKALAESLLTDESDKTSYLVSLPSNFWIKKNPWNDGDFDPLGALIRMRVDTIIIDDADSRALWLPWTVVNSGHGLALLVDETRWGSVLPNGFDVDDVWKLAQRNNTAATELQYLFRTKTPFNIARLNEDGSLNYEVVTAELIDE